MDLENIVVHGLRNFGERRAHAYASGLRDEFRWIADWPLTSRLFDEINPPVRRHVYGAHNVIYRVTDTEVVILRVFHHSVNWINYL